MVRHLQLEQFLPRDRPATFADLEHLRQTLSLIRQSQAQSFETSVTEMPRPAEDFDLVKMDAAAAASAQPAWVPTSDRSGLVERTPEQSRKAWIRWLMKQDREQPVQRQFIEDWRAKGWPHLGVTSAVPTISMEEERVRNIVANRPARFNIVDNTNDPGDLPLHSDDDFGLEEVVRLGSIIDEEARDQGVDPDLIRAILFVENAHGWYDEFLTPFGLNSTIRPMNINPDLWCGLGISRETAKDPRTNIRVGTTLLKRLGERLEDPTPRKVAALWHLTGAEHTDNEEVRNFVARVGRLYHAKPWARAPSRRQSNREPDSADDQIGIGTDLWLAP